MKVQAPCLLLLLKCSDTHQAEWVSAALASWPHGRFAWCKQLTSLLHDPWAMLRLNAMADTCLLTEVSCLPWAMHVDGILLWLDHSSSIAAWFPPRYHTKQRPVITEYGQCIHST